MSQKPNSTSKSKPGEVVLHRSDGILVSQRQADGYFNATAMCRAASEESGKTKLIGDYLRLDVTKAYIEELGAVMGIPITGLVSVVQGGRPELQGTWVHPKVAIHLAQWLSPKFSVFVTGLVTDYLSGTLKPRRNPTRYFDRVDLNENAEKIPHTHFSVLVEYAMYLGLRLQHHGYDMPAISPKTGQEMMPDISVGRFFSKRLKASGIDVDSFPTYTHEFTDGRKPQEARLYPNELRAEFKTACDEWIATQPTGYFRNRDEEADAALRELTRLIAGRTT